MTAIVIGDKATFAMLVKARTRVKARKIFLTALPGELTHARGLSVRRNVPTVAEYGSSRSVTTSSRGRVRTSNVLMRDQ